MIKDIVKSFLKKLFIYLFVFFLFAVTMKMAFALPDWCTETPCTQFSEIVRESPDVKVEFLEPISSARTEAQLNAAVDIATKNKVYINTTSFPELNIPAKISFYNTGLVNPKVFHNGELVKNMMVTRLGYQSYSILVPSFSEWTIEDSSWEGTMDNVTLRGGALQKETGYKIFYKLENNYSTTSILDTSIEQNTGILVKSPYWNIQSPRYYSVVFGEVDSNPTFLDISDVYNEFASNDNFTIVAFFNLNKTTGTQTLIDFGTSGVDGFRIYVNNANINVEIANSTHISPITGASALELYHDYMISATFNSGTLSLYKDGKLDTSAATSKAWEKGTTTAYIGVDEGLGNQFVGTAGKFLIYDQPLTQAQLYDLYYTRNVNTTNLVAYYDPVGTETTTLPDLSGNGYTATIENFDGLYRGGYGTEFGSRLFNGSTSNSEALYLGSNDDIDFTTEDFTYGGWFKTMDSSSQLMGLFGKGYSGGISPYLFQVNFPSTGKIGSYIGANSCSAWLTTASSFNINYDNNAQWNHIVQSKVGTNVTIYLNGAKAGTTTLNQTGICNNAFYYTAGSMYTYTQGFNGSISEPFIVGYGLNSSQVADLYRNSEDYHSTIINPNEVHVLTGTLISDTLSALTSIDGTSYAVGEISGTPGFEVMLDFVVDDYIDAPIKLNTYQLYDGNAAHNINIEVYNFSSSKWEVVGTITDEADYTWFNVTLYDINNYVSDNLFYVLFNHTSPGNTQHVLYIDYIGLEYNYKSYPFLYYDTASYVQRYNYTDYDVDIQANTWLNATYYGDCQDINYIKARSNSCDLIDSSSYSYYAVTQLSDNVGCYVEFSGMQGMCIDVGIATAGNSSITFALENLTLVSTRYYKPSVSDPQIAEIANSSVDGYGNATFLLNDTDEGYITFNWYVNDILVYSQDAVGLTNNTLGESTLPSSYLSKDDVVYFIAYAYNGEVVSDANQSTNVTVGNADFYFYKVNPTTENVTLNTPNNYNFKVALSDIDNDAVITWAINGESVATGTTYTFSTSANSIGLNTLTATATDGTNSYVLTWGVDVVESDYTLAMVIALGIVAGLLFFFAFKLEQDHFLLKLLLIFLGLGSVVLIPAVFSVGASNVTLTFQKLTMWLFRLFVTYFAIYIFYHWAKRSEIFVKWFGKR